MDFILHLEEWVLGMSTSPWALLILFCFCVIDGFFPFLPSEMLIVALAALAAHGEGPNLFLLIFAGGCGAFLGDQLAFNIGRLVRPEKMRLFRGARGKKALEGARRGLQKRGPVFIFAARFIPVGRVAVNLTAGATGFAYRRFVYLTMVSGPAWSIYAAVLGLVAGRFVAGRPLLAMIVGVIGGVTMGLLFDRFFTWWENRSISAREKDPAV